MVLESLITPVSALKSPWKIFLLGFLYSVAGIFLALWVFRQHASLVMVFFTTMACIPFLYNAIKEEEKKGLVLEGETRILGEHMQLIKCLMYLFVGVTFGFSLCYVFLPVESIVDTFSIQMATIAEINSNVTGNIVDGFGPFTRIFLNNIKVLIFCFLFAFIYGFGAIFILTWNASVLGAAIGHFIRSQISMYASQFGQVGIASYFHIFTIGLLRYSIHGIPEIAAFFISGLAGSIISVAVIRHDFGTKKYDKILIDTSDLMIIAILLIFIAAVLEVYVTPVFF